MIDVVDCLRRREAKYREMASLVLDQRSLFASPDMDAILCLIARKRVILGEIDALEAELAPVKADWRTVRASFSPEDARAVEAILERTQRVLQELMRLEAEGCALMGKPQETASDELKTMLGRSRARGAYGN